MKINFSKLKKISQDKDHAVFQHDDGHSVKVALAALSPKMRGQLAEMECEEPEKMKKGGNVSSAQRETTPYAPNAAPPVVGMAKGGVAHYADGTDDVSQDDSNDKPPVNININPGQPPLPNGGLEGQAADAAVKANPGTQATTGFNPNAPQQPLQVEPISPEEQQQAAIDQEPLQQAAKQPPTANADMENEPDNSKPSDPNAPPPDQAQQPQQQLTPEQEYAKAHNDFKQQHLQQYAQEDAAFQHDLENGHITPETYQSMFHDKSTLGKVGTIFGLLMSGAGSGLSHQPNALLGMMDNVIKNDLAAQIQSKQNAQNYLRTNQNAILTKAHAGKLDADSALQAYALTKMQMNRTALHDQTQNVSKLPVGSPERQNAEQGLALMYGAINNDNYDIADRAASAQALMGMNNASGGNNPESGYQKSQQALRMAGQEGLANSRDQRHIPGMQGQTSIPADKIRDQVQAMNVMDQKGRDVLNFIHNNPVGLNPKSWDPKIGATLQQKIEEMKNFYNGSIEGGALTQGRLGWYDQQFGKNARNPINQFLGSTDKLREMVNSNANRRDMLLKAYGGNPESSQPAPEYKTDSNGVKWMRGPNNKAIRVK